VSLGITPSQTVGPFFAIGLPWPAGPYAVPDGTPGAAWLRGTVTDGAGDPVPDAIIETWQADPAGIYHHPEDPRAGTATQDFRGFARCGTDGQGQYAILFVKPGPVPGPDGANQAPHLAVSVFARGLLDRVVTRVYFADEADANDADPVLGLISDPDARATLIAAPESDGYRFDIRLQGQHETAFFAI
jgi:protocatechuate 3,4-dioxygenase, alpha subunit